MNERLTELKTRLNLKWGELASKIGISVAMLGFLRRGERRPTAKILAAIASLEAATECTKQQQQMQQDTATESYEPKKESSLEDENRRLKEEIAMLRGEVRGLQFALERISQQASCA